MEIYKFDKESGKHITKFDSNFILTRITKTESPAHISCMHVGEKGLIGFHQAVVNQLLLIVHGEAKVCGEDKIFVDIKTGESAFWKKGEWHETFSEEGMTAIVIESEDMSPFLMAMQSKSEEN